MTKTAITTVEVVLARDWFGPGGELYKKDEPFKWPASDIEQLPSDASVDGKVLRKSVDLFNQAGRQSRVAPLAAEQVDEEKLRAAVERAEAAEKAALDAKAEAEKTATSLKDALEAKEKLAAELLEAKKPADSKEKPKTGLDL